ncbi:MAG: glycosyltransferase family 39 protein [Anaerolineaceae bacterium]|nr:glycosyltransferase family 39 protein [Anaerolineaceae bacterium]
MRRLGLPLLILVLATVLRLHALGVDTRFHPDEALFATFARQAAVNGDWMLRGPLDKPPLTIYAGALSMMFTGVTTLPDGVLTLDVHRGEFAARLPGTFASIILAAVMYAAARRLYPGAGDFLPLGALLLTALSPYAIAFSATAFTDGLMLLVITLALWQGAAERWGWGAVWLALGFGCKQQALLYIPLVLLVLVSRPSMRHAVRWLRFAIPLLVGLGLLFAWDAGRGQETSLWELAAANNDPGRLAHLDELLPRLGVWLGYSAVLAGTPPVTALLAALGLGVALWRIISEFRRGSSEDTVGPARSPTDRSALHTHTDAILLLYILAYGLLHWLVAFSQHDRYLLPLLPPILLLMARGLAWFVNALPGLFLSVAGGIRPSAATRQFIVFGLPLLAFLLVPAWDASEGRVPVGGDRGAHAGIDVLAEYLNAKPLATVIYDHWLGWELGYYMGAWSNKRRVYYPTPEALVHDARNLPEREPRYFPTPADAPVTPWLAALRTAGFEVRVDTRIAGYTVYVLIPPVASAESVSGAGSSWPGRLIPSGGWPG